jgi:hypothetical protein
MVTLPASQDPVVIVHAAGREAAKRAARSILRHDPDRYIVQPLTQPGAEVHVIATEDRVAVHCSLCDLVEDEHGERPVVPTKGGWVAHEACVEAVPSVRLGPVGMSENLGILPGGFFARILGRGA